MRLALGAALVGGVCLVANLFVDADALVGLGLVLLAVTVAVCAAALVRESWLMLVTSAGAVVLGWAVLETLRDVAPERQVDAIVGGVATLWVALVLLRAPRGSRDSTDSVRVGNHRS